MVIQETVFLITIMYGCKQNRIFSVILSFMVLYQLRKRNHLNSEKSTTHFLLCIIQTRCVQLASLEPRRMFVSLRLASVKLLVHSSFLKSVGTRERLVHRWNPTKGWLITGWNICQLSRINRFLAVSETYPFWNIIYTIFITCLNSMFTVI